jgi:translocation and assembly module TamB
MLDLTTHLEASAHDFIAARARQGGEPFSPLPDWHGSAKLRFAGVPLDVVPLTGDRRLKGSVRGEVKVDDLHEDARASARFDFDGLAVGRTKYKSGAVTVDAADGKVVATAHLDQEKGYFDARAASGLAWGSALVPKIDTNRAIARVSAKGFSVKVVQPFLPEAVPVLDGVLDAQAKATVHGGKTRLDGNVAFRDGRVQLTALGEELRGVRANATFTPDGKVTVRDVSAHGPRGEVRASAEAHLDGIALVDASATVDIPQRHALDVAFQGQPLGSVVGSIRVNAQSSSDHQRRTTLTIDVPKLAVELPQVTKTGVQSLDDDDRKNKEIKVGVYRGPSTFTELPLSREDTRQDESSSAKAKEQGSRLDVDVKLGAVTISRGNSARVVVAGNPKVTIASGDDSGGTTITGEVHTTTGWVDVQGKRFEIDKASIVFNGESPPNPIVTATAQWEAGDGTKVYVDFVGPVKTGKVTMRSEPPLSKDEILALVVFGSPEGANPTGTSGSSQTGATSAALGVGGGIAAQGLTQALDDLAGIQATARIDTTMTNNPKPELEVQISPRITIGYAHVVGTPPITQPDINLGKFQWRFHARWSLETTVGDRGTAMFDAVWQKRY